VDLPVVRTVQPARAAAVSVSAGRALRVLHAPAEIAGQATVLTRGLRALGIEARSLAYNPGFPQYAPDEFHPYDAQSPLPRYLGYLRTLLRHVGRWDVLHFHFGRTLVPPHNFDLPLHSALGAKIVFHWHGCDIRDRAHMRATHAAAACTECDPFCIPARQAANRRLAARFAHAELVSTPDLLESAPRARQLHVAADLADYPVAASDRTPRLVLHAPTNRLIKGTRHVEQAYAALRGRFPDVRFEVIERVPWTELRARMAEADVVVDQVFMGWYGMVAVEAMAMGKPVLCFIREDFEARLTDCPIVRCTRDSLAHELGALLEDGPRRRRLGEHGRAYVEREHDMKVVAGRLRALYEEIGARPHA
jgi:glycosyltransferase involved in cell wall biosynthesis